MSKPTDLGKYVHDLLLTEPTESALESWFNRYRTLSAAELQAIWQLLEHDLQRDTRRFQRVVDRVAAAESDEHSSLDDFFRSDLGKVYLGLARQITVDLIKSNAAWGVLRYIADHPSAEHVPAWDEIGTEARDRIGRSSDSTRDEIMLRADPVYFCEHAQHLTGKGMTLEQAYTYIVEQELAGEGIRPFATFDTFKNGFYQRGLKVQRVSENDALS